MDAPPARQVGEGWGASSGFWIFDCGILDRQPSLLFSDTKIRNPQSHHPGLVDGTVLGSGGTTMLGAIGAVVLDGRVLARVALACMMRFMSGPWGLAVTMSPLRVTLIMSFSTAVRGRPSSCSASATV